MADHKDVGEVSVTLSHDEVKAGVKEMVNKKQVEGVNSTFRVDKSTANVSGDGVTTTPIAVVVTVADPMAPKLGMDPKADPQRVKPGAATVNNQPAGDAPRVGPPKAGAAPELVSAGTPSARLTNTPAKGRGLVARPTGGPVAQPVSRARSGPLTPAAPRASALVPKRDEGPQADLRGPQADAKPGQQPGLIGVKEEVIVIQGGLNGKESRRRQIATLGKIDPDANGPSLRDRDPRHDDHGPHHGRRPSHRDAMPRHSLEDGPTPNPEAPQIVLDKPKPTAAARIAPPTAKMAQLPSAAPSPYAKT